MTVGRGQDWGDRGPLPEGGVIAHNDAEVGEVVETARRAGAPPPMIGLLGGDLWRTLGGRSDPARLIDPDAARLPVDIASVLLDGRQFWFVAHLVARHGWWRGRLVALMNAEFLGTWDVAPRAHPGDGRLDVVDVEAAFSLADRVRARRRVGHGLHVPHPRIHQVRASGWQERFVPPVRVWLDGRPMGHVRDVVARVEPGALTVVV